MANNLFLPLAERPGPRLRRCGDLTALVVPAVREKMDKLRAGQSCVEPAMKRLVTVALAFVGSLAVMAPARAQDYPSRTVTIVVPFPAGGPTDELARLIGNGLAKKFNQTFIVQNISGVAPTSAPITSRMRRPTATRCCCTTWRSPPTSRCTRGRTSASTPRRISGP
jgi:hypothetical protein